ncbi:phospholipase D zeta 1-like isoform X1 [Ipomoea triloba]|uniref:phospholipase D zeta 1-like isoform X1 n=1 Tax=Ipomoea triloba TaxID=35885 RepID=UPI00125D9DB8|nr:phospholipase D zeta 1-like isoform X1 [Ipomoea triloba]
MLTENLIGENYVSSSAALSSSSHSLRLHAEAARIFDELPKASIISVSRPEPRDISFSPLLLTYTIELRYKQFKWILLKRASQVIYLHFALKKRSVIEEFHEKQEQVKEWLHHIGIREQITSQQYDDEPDDGVVPAYNEHGCVKNRHVPSKAALPIIRPSLGRQCAILERAKSAMQDYLNCFLGNLDIVNTSEVIKFLEVSKLSFLPEYGPKLKENYVMVKHLPRISDGDSRCSMCYRFGCCKNNWQKVWAVLKPGFLALLRNPFDIELLDIFVFDALPAVNGKGKEQVNLAEEIREHNPLRYSFKVSCGNQSIKFRTASSAKVKDWVSAINEAGLKPKEGWCNTHRFGSFAPQRGLTEDGSHVQWFIDGKAAFGAIASSIESAKSEIYITGWWLCPELYLRRPFHNHRSSRLDVLLEAKANQGVQIFILLYKEVALALKINSLYSKKKLLSIHKNVKVLRYPNHLSAGIYYWSHHEKIVIVDHHICFIGGLDLCFGRYDTVEHKIGDYPPFLWPGKDYYNPRESEPNSWEDAMRDELDREKYPRMPWHDVHCALWGPPCRDIARHFVQRWNHAKRSKAANEQEIPLLMPKHHMVIPHYLGRSQEVDIESKNAEVDAKDLNGQDLFASGSPPEDIPLLLPQEASGMEASNLNNTLDDVCGQLDPLDQTTDLQDGWWEKVSVDELAEAGPRTPCSCQVIRSVSHWSAGTSYTEDSIHTAYCSLIENAEHFVYIEGGLDDSGAASVRAIMHWQYRTICRGQNSILHNLNALLGQKASDYISFCGLRTYGQLSDSCPLVTSQVYVHSKLMIVDDRIALVGSSNINDRSLLGSRDSEIAVVIEDKDFIESSMDGKPWKAGRFAFSLRVSLWAEHLGLRTGEISQIKDPIADSTYKDLWLSTAKLNATIYQDVFSCIPNDLIYSRSALRQCKERLRHNTVDLGVAPKKLRVYVDDKVTIVNPTERVKSIKGHLVHFPLEFMREEDLRPVFIDPEFYTNPHVFH